MGYRAAPSFCRECGAALGPDVGACVRCGTVPGPVEPPRPADGSIGRGVASALALYFVLLLTLLVPLVVKPTDVLALLDKILIVDTVVVLIWALVHRDDIGPLLRRVGTASDWGLTLLAVPVTVTVALANVWLATEVLGVPDVDLFQIYFDAGYSLPLVLVLMAVQPAVVEELAFRGIVMERLSALVEPKVALVIAAVLFASLHLAFLSIVFLIVLGLIAGWLRLRSGSLYPAIALHLLHNTCVILLVAWG